MKFTKLLKDSLKDWRNNPMGVLSNLAIEELKKARKRPLSEKISMKEIKPSTSKTTIYSVLWDREALESFKKIPKFQAKVIIQRFERVRKDPRHFAIYDEKCNVYICSMFYKSALIDLDNAGKVLIIQVFDKVSNLFKMVYRPRFGETY